MAEVMKYNDFKEEGSENAVKVCVCLYIFICTLASMRFIYKNPLQKNLKTKIHSLNLFCLLQAAGKYRQQGRNYIVEDGDIIFFKFNTPNAPKKKP